MGWAGVGFLKVTLYVSYELTACDYDHDRNEGNVNSVPITKNSLLHVP